MCQTVPSFGPPQYLFSSRAGTVTRRSVTRRPGETARTWRLLPLDHAVFCVCYHRHDTSRTQMRFCLRQRLIVRPGTSRRLNLKTVTLGHGPSTEDGKHPLQAGNVAVRQADCTITVHRRRRRGPRAGASGVANIVVGVAPRRGCAWTCVYGKQPFLWQAALFCIA